MATKNLSKAVSEGLSGKTTEESTTIIVCDICGKTMSSELPEDAVVRGWNECMNCAQAFQKRPDMRAKPDAATGFTLRGLIGEKGEYSVSEKDYENLVQRLVDFVRKNQNKLPLVIIIK